MKNDECLTFNGSEVNEERGTLKDERLKMKVERLRADCSNVLRKRRFVLMFEALMF